MPFTAKRSTAPVDVRHDEVRVSAQPGETQPQPLQVLVVEDSLADYDIVQRALQRTGVQAQYLRVDTAVDLRGALAKQRWDIVISDFNLPTFDGFSALAEVKSFDVDLPFILVSGTVGEDVAVQALQKGADDYLLKGNLTRLAPAVGRGLREADLRRTRRRALDALQRSEAKYRDLIAHAVDGFFVCSWSGEFLVVNERYCDILGYSEPELLKMNAMETFPSEERDESRARLDRLKAGQPVQYERLIVRRDGSELPVEINMRLLGDGNIEGILRDITERKRAEAAAAEERTLLLGLMDNTPDFIFFKDLQLRFLRVNAALEKQFTKRGLNNVVGRQGHDLLPRDVARELERQERHILTSGKPVINELDRVELPGGQVGWRSRTEVPIRNAKGEVTALVGVSRDVTKQHRVEEQVRRLNRVYAVLSGINALIVRVRDRDTLFREACRIAVDSGGFTAAWIGVADPVAGRLVPAASAGRSEDHLKRIEDGLQITDSRTLSFAARSYVEGRTMIANDIATDERVLFKSEHAQSGTRSMGIFPLRLDGKPFAVFFLYSGEAGFFDEKEMQLLEELGADVGFALDHIANLDRLDFLAHYDRLTGLPNRYLFEEQVAGAVEQASREAVRFAIAVIDIDDFKSINDTLGQDAGDELLRQVAQRLPSSVSANVANKPARLGADQFALISRNMTTDEEMARRAETAMQKIFGTPFLVGDTELRVSGKAGMAIFPDHGRDGRALFNNAEAALKNAKASGEPFLIFTEQMTGQVAARLALANKLRRALERDEFVLHYQPKVELSGGTVVGLEALIRWNDRETGRQVPPLQFIPLLEEIGLIIEVGSWALRQAADDHRKWLDAGLAAPRIAVNVSPIQLRRRDFVKVVADAVSGDACPPGSAQGTGPALKDSGIDLEITESLIMEDFEGTVGKLNQLRDMGMNMAIDDFGTGYSSLAYLARLPVETLKIDRSFIITMLKDPNIMTLVTTVITLAHSFGLKVVAEGVDSEEQVRLLRLLRCDQMQGYLFSKPVPAEEIPGLLDRRLGGAP